MVLNSLPGSRIIRAAYGPSAFLVPGNSGGPRSVKGIRGAMAQVPADGELPGGRLVVAAAVQAARA
jgi:hypothetical protein